MVKAIAETRRAATWGQGMPEVASEGKDDKKENHLFGFVLRPIIFFCWSTTFQMQTFYKVLRNVDIDNNEKQ